jgi:hypothetical protein
MIRKTIFAIFKLAALLLALARELEKQIGYRPDIPWMIPYKKGYIYAELASELVFILFPEDAKQDPVEDTSGSPVYWDNQDDPNFLGTMAAIDLESILAEYNDEEGPEWGTWD